MWSAFMNGSGGGAGGGYVPSQGWEYVPRSRMERAEKAKGKNRSPLRRISSPPTVFSQEPHFGASQSGAESGTGTQILEILKGQMWPGSEAQHAQHARLKKKFEDLKKRHIQEKEEWMREKESLLREVANIQGGENRRILLDLKTVLDEVQSEVKKEEEKRSELQLQYTRDRCAWELEKAELKCRIAQLEAREATGLVCGGLQSPASRSPRELHGETSALRREREDQRKIVAEAHSAAMDLSCRLEHSERDWLRERAELLQRFDVERKEWESQLKDMQRKIEELYCEVRFKRGSAGRDGGKHDDELVRRLSMRSTSTGSSLLSDNLSSSTQSEPTRNLSSPHLGSKTNIHNDGGDNHQSTCFQTDSLLAFNVCGRFSQREQLRPELQEELRSRASWQLDSAAHNKEAVDTSELDVLYQRAPTHPVLQEPTSKPLHDGLHESSVWEGLSFGSEKKKNNTALNAALKEIARVSEELCSYQDEMKAKFGDKRNSSDSLCPSHEKEKNSSQTDDVECDLSQIYADLRALEREHWINLSPDNTWQANKAQGTSWTAETADVDFHRAAQSSPGGRSETDTAPPIPPRTSSWNLCSSNLDTELHIPESPVATVRKCHSPCVLVDRKCNSPSIVRKFEAMLQENEGKFLKDGMITSCPVPTNSNCSISCCHNRWSCDASKFTQKKLSAYGTVQKSFSEINILSAGRDLSLDCSSTTGVVQTSPTVRELPVNLLLSSLATPSASPNLQNTKRNILLEKKTAEFNRTLFQAEMGRGADVQDDFPPTETSQPILTEDVLPSTENTFQPIHSDFPSPTTDLHPQVSSSLSKSDSVLQNIEVQPRQISSSPEVQKVQIKPEILVVHSPEHPLSGLCGVVTESQSPEHHCEVFYKVQTANSPFRKSQMLATEVLSSESVLPAHPQPGLLSEREISKENFFGILSQAPRAAAVQSHPSTSNKEKQATQSRYAPCSSVHSESPRPGPRMMIDHPWKPLTLAAYPRPEGSRSNYGAVERILKNYENAARAQQNTSKEKETDLSSNLRRDEKITEQEMLDMKPLFSPPTPRRTQTPLSSPSSQAAALVSSGKSVKDIHLVVQEDEEFLLASSSSIQKNFSRPARPANRRLPSRWASRSPTSSSSASSSPSTTPVVPPTFSHQKHAPSFSYSHGFHIETVIL